MRTQTNSGIERSSGGYFGQYQLSDDFVKMSGNQKFGFGANFARLYWSVFPKQNGHVA
jgi:hypothetical protein